jgi:hypothetical protein
MEILNNYYFCMLNWDFIKNDPVTYRAIEGAMRFEVTVERDNRKGTITVTRTEGDKFAIKVFRDHRKNPWRHESFFWSFPFMMNKATI